MISRLAIASFVILSAAAAHAQIKLPGGGKLPDLKIPGLDSILKGEDPLTTSIKDIKLLGWPEFDHVQLTDTVTLTATERSAAGTFRLKPGSYKATLQTFCARGYTYGPTEGMGYVLGEWKGSKAPFLQSLMKAYGQKGGVAQEDVQLLVWAVLAKVKPQNMSDGAKRALVQLMGQDATKMMAEGAVDYLNDSVMREVNKQLSPALRPFFEADNKMRGLFAKAGTSYAEFEKIGVLKATEPLKSSIPKGRWNLHPQGYLVRYFPAGYSQTTSEIIVPHVPQVKKDDKGRVVDLKIADFSMQITYDDARRSTAYPSDPGMVAHPVAKVRIEVPEARGGVLEKSSSTEWVFVGSPKKAAHQISQDSYLLRLITRAPFQDFDRWRERYEGANDLNDRIETYEEWWERTQRIERGERPNEDVFNSDHIRDMIESLFGGSDDRLGVIAETHGRLAEWLAYATGVLDSMSGDAEIDPSDGLIIPANGGSQRLAGSAQFR